MKKTKRFATTLVLLALCISYFNGFVSSSNAETTSPASSVLAEKAEIVVLGKVNEQTCVYQDDVIVTRNNITIEKVYSGDISVGETLFVQQLGGTIGSVNVPYLTGITVIKPGITYVMFLYAKEATDGFLYYQSVGNYNVTLQELGLSEDANLTQIEFAIDNVMAQQPMPLSSAGLYSGGWNLTEVDVYVSCNSTVTYGGSLYTYLKNGVTTWNNCSSLTVTTKNAATACEVFVYMGDYDLSQYATSGITGDVAGATTYSTGGSRGNHPDESPYYKAYIYLDKKQYSTSAYDKWKAVVCHEMGHALGLAHSNNDGYKSIMTEGTADYFNGSISSAPTAGDKKLLKAKYG